MLPLSGGLINLCSPDNTSSQELQDIEKRIGCEMTNETHLTDDTSKIQENIFLHNTFTCYFSGQIFTNDDIMIFTNDKKSHFFRPLSVQLDCLKPYFII